MFKSGYVSILGRPNVGKSTLLNMIMKEKLAIVSDKPQTTRSNMQAIYNDEESQIIFVDTPGMHKPKHKLGEYMVSRAKESTNDVDLIILMVEPDVDMGPGDKYLIEMLKEKKTPVFLIVNKIDEKKQNDVADTLKNYSSLMDFTEIVPISAFTGKNVETLMTLIKKHLPEGPKYYPDDIMADVQEKFIVSETVREKALRLLRDEIPHGIAIEVTKMKERESGEIDIEADLITEKESHKPIIIGKGGQSLKKIGMYAREDLERFFRTKVNIKLFVKVRKDWRDNPNFLREYGYKKEK